MIEFAKAFIDGEVDCDGDIWQAVGVFDALRDRRQTRSERILEALYSGLVCVPWVGTLLGRSLTHYELNADAYELFLDRHMQYTCGYFKNSEMSIDEAQEAKFHLIRDQVGLIAGSQHLDVGCGWGGLAGYFQREFGARSIGITNCASQARYARERFEVDSVLADFSALKDFADKFDLITIVGMIEHLRPGQQSNLFQTLSRLLKAGGQVYLQCIVRAPSWVGGDGSRFLQRNVFPGYFIDDASKLEVRLQTAGYSIVKKMEHSEHYGYTAARWAERIQSNQIAVRSLIGDREYRVFLGYLAMASKIFHDRRGCLMRYVLARRVQ